MINSFMNTYLGFIIDLFLLYKGDTNVKKITHSGD